MGQAAAKAGRPTTLGRTSEARVAAELAQRERTAKSKALLEGGKSKGETKGYGGTAAPIARGGG